MKLRHSTGFSVAGAIVALSASVMVFAGNQLFDIKEQSLVKALNQFASQADIQLSFSKKDVSQYQVNQIRGDMSTDQVLKLLLAGTDLGYEYVSESAVVIKKANVGAGENGTNFETKPRVLEGSKKSIEIEEVLVTASKRGSGSTIQDTAMSISAIGGGAISKKGIVGMGDYLATIPGVSQADFGVGRNRISIRGVVGSSTEQLTVGSYLGEVPLGQTDVAGSTTDIKLVDIERIEVLRGPQGTLYGSSSLAGAIRNIPNAPRLEELEFTIEAGFSGASQSSGVSNKLTGVINIPLIDNKLAMRIAAYRFDNEGYVDLVTDDPEKVAAAAAVGATLLNEKDVGDTEYTGARVSLLWQPIDELNVTLMHVTQDLEQNGFNEVTLPVANGYQAYSYDLGDHLGGAEFLGDEVDITNLVVEYDLGWGNFISSSTVSKSTIDRIRDLSRFSPQYAAFNGTAQLAQTNTDDFFQEFRVSSNFDGSLQFVGGVYYEDRESVAKQDLVWIGDDALQPSFMGTDPDNILHMLLSDEVQQTAFFGELSYDLSDQLTLTVGARRFDYDRRLLIINTGFFATPTVDTRSTESGTRGKVNISYTPNEDVLLYAQWAQGFRLGRPLEPVLDTTNCDTNNDGILDGTSAPMVGALDSDALDNYELGGKFSLMDNRLAVNTSVYRIDWTDLPVNVVGTCGFGSSVNGGEAVIHGMEIEAEYALSDALHVTVGASYNNPELANDNSLGVKGDRLPLSPRVNGNVGVEYNFQLAGYDSFVRADYAYVGDYYNDFKQTSIKMGDYDKLGLRAGVSIDNLDIELYGRNLTNSDDLTLVIFDLYSRGIRVAPRQIGLDIRYRF